MTGHEHTRWQQNDLAEDGVLNAHCPECGYRMAFVEELIVANTPRNIHCPICRVNLRIESAIRGSFRIDVEAAGQEGGKAKGATSEGG
jgi:hypothetical protein